MPGDGLLLFQMLNQFGPSPKTYKLGIKTKKTNARKQNDIVVAIIDSGVCLKPKNFFDEGIRSLKEHKFHPSNDKSFKLIS